MKHIIHAALAASMALASVANAHEFTSGTLTVAHVFAFETPKTARVGAGYMMITNSGPEADTLLSVKADFPKVMLHKTEEQDGVARMLHMDAVEIPAGATVAFEPGGLHVMFMGLNGDPLERGEKIPATLVFENAGDVSVIFTVMDRKAGSKAMDHSNHGATN